MPRKSPFLLQLTAEQRRELQRRARADTLPYRDVVRAKMVLLAADGLDNDGASDHPAVVIDRVSLRLRANTTAPA